MPHYNGPYTVTDIDKEHSTVTLDLPNSPNICPTFHTSEVLPYIESDTTIKGHLLGHPGYSAISFSESRQKTQYHSLCLNMRAVGYRNLST